MLIFFEEQEADFYVVSLTADELSSFLTRIFFFCVKSLGLDFCGGHSKGAND